MPNILELQNVSFSALHQTIVSDFSYQFEEGKTTALVGPSGCGKSTVLKLCAGILVPASGDVIFRGLNIAEMNRHENLEFRKDAAMVFQDSALWANQTLFGILELPLRIHFPQMTLKERESRINDVLGEVGYRRDTRIRPFQLSMGEQKLIAFARAIICGPRILFLDEWTESLDDSGAKRLIGLVQKHQKENHTVIIISHDFRIIKTLADFVVMILDGKFYLNFTRQQIEEDRELARYVENGIAS